MDFTILIIWLGCFLVVAIDSAFRGISPVFWRLAALVGGPLPCLPIACFASTIGRNRGYLVTPHPFSLSPYIRGV